MAAIFRQSPVKSPSIKRLVVQDVEFGAVPCRRMSSSKYVRIRLQPDGSLSATLPPRAPLDLVQQLINDSRDELRRHVTSRRTSGLKYSSGMSIGSSHTLTITPSSAKTPKASVHGQRIHVVMPSAMHIDHPDVQKVARDAVKRALTQEAKAFLPRRLRYLANLHGFHFSKIRFTNAKGRWGSCSSQGTISLNIALMRLDHHLIDYVLFHELTHTEHMNHSDAFWRRLGELFPDYAGARTRLKQETPYL